MRGGWEDDDQSQAILASESVVAPCKTRTASGVARSCGSGRAKGPVLPCWVRRVSPIVAHSGVGLTRLAHKSAEEKNASASASDSASASPSQFGLRAAARAQRAGRREKAKRGYQVGSAWPAE